MADQFFFDAAVNTCDSAGNIDDQAQTTMGEQKTFSQFNQWTLVDQSDVEEMETNIKFPSTNYKISIKVNAETVQIITLK